MKKGEEITVLLLKKSFDIEEALSICAEDMELYMDILGTALEEGERKLPIISESAERKDYERYHIEVHGLKNAMRAIGAMELSSLSLEQEQAAKAKNYEKIDKDAPVLIEKYKEVLDILKEIFIEE